jgi:hypothetical protein
MKQTKYEQDGVTQRAVVETNMDMGTEKDFLEGSL